MGSQRVLSEFQEFLLSHATEAEKSTLSCEGLPSAGRLPPLRDPRSKKLLRPLHIFSPQSPQKTRHNPTDISVVKTGVLVNSQRHGVMMLRRALSHSRLEYNSHLRR